MGSFLYNWQFTVCVCTVCTHTANMRLAGSLGLIMGSAEQTIKWILSCSHTHTHTHTHICFIHIATSTAVYTPSVLSPGWFWHRHRNQKTSHISNANCPSGQKWSTSVEYHSEFQTKEQLGEEQLRNAGHKHVFEYKFDWWRRFLFEWVRPGDLCFVPICPPVKRLAQSKGKIVFLKRQVSVANCVKKK